MVRVRKAKSIFAASSRVDYQINLVLKHIHPELNFSFSSQAYEGQGSRAPFFPLPGAQVVSTA